MIKRELLGTAQVPGGERLELYSHDRDFMIVLGRNELMSTRMRGSEEALATMSIERLGRDKPLRLLIGGYGMGFTLRAALANLGPPGARHRVRAGSRDHRMGARPDAGGRCRLPRRSARAATPG